MLSLVSQGRILVPTKYYKLVNEIHIFRSKQMKLTYVIQATNVKFHRTTFFSPKLLMRVTSNIIVGPRGLYICFGVSFSVPRCSSSSIPNVAFNSSTPSSSSVKLCLTGIHHIRKKLLVKRPMRLSWHWEGASLNNNRERIYMTIEYENWYKAFKWLLQIKLSYHE